MTTALAVELSTEAEAFAASLLSRGLTTPSGEWSAPDADKENAYIASNGFEAYGKWFLGRNSEEDPATKAHYEFPFSNDFEKVHRQGLLAIRSRAAQNGEETIFEAAGRLLELYEEDASEEASRTGTFFAGSPRSKFNTHASAGFKGDYAAAWRIHFSQVGGAT